ncbi:MAG: hypothetical protein DBY17_03625 [Oscillospiraceae bacterium]|nr:MAG: hypothetical protein DBY17_03625 [Oscillospiraceae bacterium]
MNKKFHLVEKLIEQISLPVCRLLCSAPTLFRNFTLPPFAAAQRAERQRQIKSTKNLCTLEKALDNSSQML